MLKLVTQREATAALRVRIVDAAIGQLIDAGMRGLTHRKVENRCGIAQGLVKYHFGSIDALVEAVLDRIAGLQLPFVLDLDEQERADLARGVVAPELLARAAAASEELWSQLDLAKARFEIYLYAYRRPNLQEMIGRARGEFVARIARELPGGRNEAGARMLAALADGLMIDEISAPEPMVRELTPAYLFTAGTAAARLDGLTH